MSQSANDGFGALRFPVPAASTALDLDPGKTAIMGLLEAALNAELGTVWQSLTSTLKSDHYLVKQGLCNPVMVTSPVEVTNQQMMQWKAAWPLLAVYRTGEPEVSDFTTHYSQIAQDWSVDYVIGPLDVSHQVRLGGICVAVAKVVCSVISRGRHPAYDSGARQFRGQFTSIEVKSIQGPGIAQSLGEESGSGYYGMCVILRTVERQVFDGYSAADTFESNTGYVALGTGTAPTLTEIWNDVDIDNETADAVDDEPAT